MHYIPMQASMVLRRTQLFTLSEMERSVTHLVRAIAYYGSFGRTTEPNYH